MEVSCFINWFVRNISHELHISLTIWWSNYSPGVISKNHRFKLEELIFYANPYREGQEMGEQKQKKKKPTQVYKNGHNWPTHHMCCSIAKL
jgi:hypothetical protein